MKYEVEDYEKSLSHINDIINIYPRVVLGDAELDTFVNWFNLALNDGCDIESTVKVVREEKGKGKNKKTVIKALEVTIGDFFVTDQHTREDNKYSADGVSDTVKAAMLTKFLLNMVRIWCNLKRFQPDLFIKCFKPKDIYSFLRLISSYHDEEEEDVLSEYEKIIFKDADSTASSLNTTAFLIYKDAAYTILMPFMNMDASFNEDDPEWFEFAMKGINDRAIESVEDVYKAKAK